MCSSIFLAIYFYVIKQKSDIEQQLTICHRFCTFMTSHHEGHSQDGLSLCSTMSRTSSGKNQILRVKKSVAKGFSHLQGFLIPISDSGCWLPAGTSAEVISQDISMWLLFVSSWASQVYSCWVLRESNSKRNRWKLHLFYDLASGINKQPHFPCSHKPAQTQEGEHKPHLSKGRVSKSQ